MGKWALIMLCLIEKYIWEKYRAYLIKNSAYIGALGSGSVELILKSQRQLTLLPFWGLDSDPT